MNNETFSDIESLDQLNIFGCVTDEGLEFLRMQLSPTIINGSALSNIARLSLK